MAWWGGTTGWFTGSTNGDQTGTGVNLRSFVAAEESGNNTTTTMAFGTGAGGAMVVNPLTAQTSFTSVPAANAAAATLGWQPKHSFLGNDTGFVTRSVVSGTWTVTVPMSANVAQTGIAGDVTTYTAILYKIASDNSSTELGRATGTFIASITPTGVTMAITNVAAVTFNANESFRIVFYFAAAGKAVTGFTLTLAYGESGSITPGPNTDQIILPAVLKADVRPTGGNSNTTLLGGATVKPAWRSTNATGPKTSTTDGGLAHPIFRSTNATGPKTAVLDGGPGRVYANELNGLTRDATGALLTSCRVDYFRSGSNAFIASTTSDPTTAAYSFIVLGYTGAQTYFVRSYKANGGTGGINVFGTSDETLQPVVTQTAGP